MRARTCCPTPSPHPEVAVVSAVTPSGGRLAGKYDLSMICVAATNPFGYDALAANWQIANDIAAEHGRTMDPTRLRLVGPMHIAETREKAYRERRFGFERYLGYLNNNQPRFIVPDGKDPLEWFVENSFGVIGTPDDAIALIERLQDKQGAVRRLPAPGAQLGRLGGDQAVLRALCPLRDAAFLRRQRAAHRLVRLVRRTSRRAQRKALRRRARHVRQARGRAARRAGGTRSSADGATEDRTRGVVTRRIAAISGVILTVLDHPASARHLLAALAAPRRTDRRPTYRGAARARAARSRRRAERGDAHRSRARRNSAQPRLTARTPYGRCSMPGCPDAEPAGVEAELDRRRRHRGTGCRRTRRPLRISSWSSNRHGTTTAPAGMRFAPRCLPPTGRCLSCLLGRAPRFGRRVAIAWRDDDRATKAVLAGLRCLAQRRACVRAGRRAGTTRRPAMPAILARTWRGRGDARAADRVRRVRRGAAGQGA